MGTFIKGVCRWFKDTSQFNKNFKEFRSKIHKKNFFRYLINCVEQLENLENECQLLNLIKCVEK